MLSIRDYLIVLVTNTSHKAHLLSCALRCSSKLKEIQSLENFVSIAIQGTCTNTHCFCTFFIFQIFFLMKNKIKQNLKQTNKNMLNKTKHKTRLTQKTRKQNKHVMHNHKGRKRKSD